MKTIKDLLSEASNGVLSEDVINQIDTLFNEAVELKTNERVKLAVEAALDADDTETIKLFEDAVSKLDKVHAKQLVELLSKQSELCERKLEKQKNTYTRLLNNDARKFKENILESISLFVEENIERHIPKTIIKEAAENTKQRDVVQKLREVLAIDSALENDVVQGTLAEAKSLINKKEEQTQKLIAEKTKEAEAQKAKCILLEKQKNETERRLILEQHTQKFEGRKKNFILEQFEGKTLDYIKENLPYVAKQYDAFVEQRREQVMTEAKKASVMKKMDTPKEILAESKRAKTIEAEKPSNQPKTEVDGFVQLMKESSHQVHRKG